MRATRFFLRWFGPITCTSDGGKPAASRRRAAASAAGVLPTPDSVVGIATSSVRMSRASFCVGVFCATAAAQESRRRIVRIGCMVASGFEGALYKATGARLTAHGRSHPTRLENTHICQNRADVGHPHRVTLTCLYTLTRRGLAQRHGSDFKLPEAPLSAFQCRGAD